MDDSLSLTTILPTYNERGNIPILIEGILAAVQTPVKVLVVDDNSPDGTSEVVAEIAAAGAARAPDLPHDRARPHVGHLGRHPGRG